MSIARNVEAATSSAAACATVDPELFFPVSEQQTHQIDRAKSFCRACPVQASCLSWALEAGLAEGIFGGLTATERRRVRLLRRGESEADVAAGRGEVAA